MAKYVNVSSFIICLFLGNKHICGVSLRVIRHWTGRKIFLATEGRQPKTSRKLVQCSAILAVRLGRFDSSM